MNAKDAKLKTQQAKDQNLNFQRNCVLQKIASACNSGCNFIILDDDLIVLSDEDLEFFKHLGYKVIPQKSGVRNGMPYHSFGRIKW